MNEAKKIALREILNKLIDDYFLPEIEKPKEDVFGMEEKPEDKITDMLPEEEMVKEMIPEPEDVQDGSMEEKEKPIGISLTKLALMGKKMKNNNKRKKKKRK